MAAPPDTTCMYSVPYSFFETGFLTSVPMHQIPGSPVVTLVNLLLTQRSSNAALTEFEKKNLTRVKCKMRYST